MLSGCGIRRNAWIPSITSIATTVYHIENVPCCGSISSLESLPPYDEHLNQQGHPHRGGERGPLLHVRDLPGRPAPGPTFPPGLPVQRFSVLTGTPSFALVSPSNLPVVVRFSDF